MDIDPKLLLEMTSQGFLIIDPVIDSLLETAPQNFFTVKKFPTAKNRTALSEDEIFESHEDAINYVKRQIDWKVELPFVDFSASIGYNYGLGAMFEELGIIKARHPDDVKIEAERLAQRFFDKTPETKEKTWSELKAGVVFRPIGLSKI